MLKSYSAVPQLFSDVYLSLNDVIIPNHGYVDISDIGTTYDSALICHTNRPAGGANSGGDWYGPNGNEVDFFMGVNVPGFVANRAPMMVRLKKYTTGFPSDGIYHCVVNDSKNISHTIYVGIYNSEPESGKSQQ